jgi:hypothetical protein
MQQDIHCPAWRRKCRRIPAPQYCFEYIDENAAMTTKKLLKKKKASKLPAFPSHEFFQAG